MFCSTRRLFFTLIALMANVAVQAQTLLVSNYTNSTITKITSNGVSSNFSNSVRQPTGLAFDAHRNLYVGNSFTDTITKIAPDGTTSNFATAINRPEGLAFDNDGNLYVADYYVGTVSKIPRNGGTAVFFASLSHPAGGLAFDRAGNLFVSSGWSGPPIISKVTPEGVVSVFARDGGMISPWGLGFDSNGILYVANGYPGGNSVSKITPAHVVSTFVSGSNLAGLYGLAVDGNDNVYVASYSNSTISKITPQGVVSLFASGIINPSYLTIVPQNNAAISGTILLENYVPAAISLQSVIFELHPTDGGASITQTKTLGSDGTFTLSNIPQNAYTVHIKGAKWLAQNVSVDTTNGDVSGMSVTLKAGDANNDNFADIADLLLLIGHYNQVAPSVDYLEAADFNGDGSNDISDLLLLIGNYNQQGDL